MELITIPFDVFKSNWHTNALSSQSASIDKAIEDLKKTFEGCFSGIYRDEGGRNDSFRRMGGKQESLLRQNTESHPRQSNSESLTRQGNTESHPRHTPDNNRYASRNGHWGNTSRQNIPHASHAQNASSHRRGHGGHSSRRFERPRIGNRDLCREDLSRKDFIANLNKMSPQNYEIILRHIRTTYNSTFLESYMDIIWNMMVRQMDYQDMYIIIIQHLLDITPESKKQAIFDYWNGRCNTYFETHAWMPTKELLNSITEEYDEFCDYIKWKKQTAAHLTGWLRLMHSGIVRESYQSSFDRLFQQTEEAIQEASDRLLDCFLEWILRMVSVNIPYNYPETYITQLKDWVEIIKERGFSSALRFKIVDILTLIQKK